MTEGVCVCVCGGGGVYVRVLPSVSVCVCACDFTMTGFCHFIWYERAFLDLKNNSNTPHFT